MLPYVIVPVRHRPAAMGKAAVCVFIDAAGRLDHTVKGDEFCNNKLSHFYSCNKKERLSDHWLADLDPV
jgi:hypothetical protein